MAAALVFDAAPHMEYRHENRTRLEAARELAQWLVAQLPEHSEIAVLDTRLGSPAAFAPDRGAAKERIARLESTSNSQSLPAAIDEAVKLLQPSKLERKEIYVFSDLSRGGWPEEQSPRLRRQLAEIGGLGVYVIDMGIDNPTDYGLSEARLSGDVLSSLGTLKIDADLSCLGAAAGRVVELHMQDASGKPQKRGQRSCAAKPGESCHVTFSVSGLTPGVHQGFLRIVGQDGLAADDTRYFTVLVKPAWRVLLAAPKPAERYARFFSEAISPESYRQSGQARFECDVCELTGLAKRQLADYAAVCLLDPTPLAGGRVEEAGRLRGRRARRGDLFGAKRRAGRFVQPTAGAGAIAGRVVAPGDCGGRRVSCPARFRASDPFGVPRLCRLDPLGRLSRPALLGVQVIGQGCERRAALQRRAPGRFGAARRAGPRVGDDHAGLRSAERESLELSAGRRRVAVRHVGRSDDSLSGRQQRPAVELSCRADGRVATRRRRVATRFHARCARRNEFVDRARSGTTRIGRQFDRSGGQLSASGGRRRRRATLGFSVNYAAGQTRLDRMTEGELAGVFGPVKYQLPRTRRQIDRDVHVGRIGRELYPPLILIVALLLGLEMLLANRFYKE